MCKKKPVNFEVFESMEELSETVYSYIQAEKSSIQPWMNLINVSLVRTQHSLPSPASTNFVPWCGEAFDQVHILPKDIISRGMMELNLGPQIPSLMLCQLSY